MEERPYQHDACKAVEDALQQGIHNQLLSMATGTGKTVVFCKLYERLKAVLPGKMLILAHTEELVDQSITQMKEINPHLKVDKEMAAHHADPTSDVVVASVATLGRAGTSRIGDFDWNEFDKIVCDEAHHSIADSYCNIFAAVGVVPPSHRLLLGVTATPNRGDGEGLSKIYERIVYNYSLRQAIEDKYLADVKGYHVKTTTNLDSVHTVAGDFNKAELSQTVDNEQRNELVYKAWNAVAHDRQTIVFAVNIEHAQHLAETFQEHGVNAEAIWGKDPDRKQKLKDHKKKELQVLVNCAVLTEGYDDSSISCIVLARPTKSGTLFTQMVGRGTRKAPGKDDCMVIDVVDASHKHRLVTLPTLMGLPKNLALYGQSLLFAVKEIEAAQQEYPYIDFGELSDIDDLKAFIKRVDLFNVNYPEEIEQATQLGWYRAANGGFKLYLPDEHKQGCETLIHRKCKCTCQPTHQYLTIKQNLLDKWEVFGVIGKRKFKGVRDTRDEAFLAADTVVRGYCPTALNVVSKKSAWHDHPMTDAQRGVLQKIYKGKPLPVLTKGKASMLISHHLAKKEKGYGNSRAY